MDGRLGLGLMHTFLWLWGPIVVLWLLVMVGLIELSGNFLGHLEIASFLLLSFLDFFLNFSLLLELTLIGHVVE